MSDLEALNARDDLREMADRYEQVAALDLPLPSSGGGIGARVPKGAQEMLDEDEIMRALTALDEWAEFSFHVVIDEASGVPADPRTTPGRLRIVAEYTRVFIDSADEWLAVAWADELSDHLGRTRRLALRGGRKILTGAVCTRIGCDELLFSFLPADGTKDDRLHCPRGHEVPYETWHRWPRTKTTFITAQHAARLLGIEKVAAVWKRASREKWRRIGSGRDVRYHVEDVRRAAGMG